MKNSKIYGMTCATFYWTSLLLDVLFIFVFMSKTEYFPDGILQKIDHCVYIRALYLQSTHCQKGQIKTARLIDGASNHRA